MIKKYLLLSLLFTMPSVSAGQEPSHSSSSRTHCLYTPASATARAMTDLEDREEIGKLVARELPKYAESDRQMVLNYWLECVLSHRSFREKEILQAEVLLDRGADINAKSLELLLLGSGQSSHETLLQESVSLGRLKAVEFLLEHGADFIRLNSCTGQTALHMAAGKCGEKKACALIDLLANKMPIDRLSCEPDPDCAKNWCYAGETALWTALRNREPNTKVVQKLLMRGAQPNYPHPVSGKLPLDYALEALHSADADLRFIYQFDFNRDREKQKIEEKEKISAIAKTLYCFGSQSSLLTPEEREEFERAREQFLLNDDYLEYKYDLFGPKEEQGDQDGIDNNAQDGCVIL